MAGIITITATTMAGTAMDRADDERAGCPPSYVVGMRAGRDGDGDGNPVPDPRLQIWLSPAFPAGGFAYSHGLEWAVEAGEVRGLAPAVEWLGALLEHGALRNDCVLAAAAWRAAVEGDAEALGATNALALALAGSAERYLETSQQGTSFLLAVGAAWPTPALGRIGHAIGAVAAWPVAVGACAGAHAIRLDATLAAFATAGVNALVSVLIRLGAIGQTDGQRVMAALLAPVARTVEWAARSTIDDLGQAAFRSDLAAIRHETQYTRLFRS